MDAMTVRFYDGAALVRTHARVGPGKRATVESDFPQAGSALAKHATDRSATDMQQYGPISAECVACCSPAHTRGARCAAPIDCAIW